MRKLLSLILVVTLWFSCAIPAFAAENQVSGLVRCADSPAFQQRAKNARNTTDDPRSGQKRFERYSQAYCGPEGLPHLIVDGRLSRAGDFMIPGILFLYIAGWIGWVGRAYLIAIRDEKDSEMKEVMIDVPLAFSIMLGGFAWPLAAIKELTTGELTAKETEIPISPR